MFGFVIYGALNYARSRMWSFVFRVLGCRDLELGVRYEFVVQGTEWRVSNMEAWVSCFQLSSALRGIRGSNVK